MFTWLNYWHFIVWFSIFAFCLNLNSFLNLLIFSEITWISLYTYTLVIGVQNDEITILSNSFLILGLASLEFSIGLLLIILYKNFFKSISLAEVDETWRQTCLNNNSKLYIYKYIWETKKST